MSSYTPSHSPTSQSSQLGNTSSEPLLLSAPPLQTVTSPSCTLQPLPLRLSPLQPSTSEKTASYSEELPAPPNPKAPLSQPLASQRVPLQPLSLNKKQRKEIVRWDKDAATQGRMTSIDCVVDWITNGTNYDR